MLIDVETYEYFSVHSAGSEGVLVLIQHYRDIPLMRKESFVLSPGSIEYIRYIFSSNHNIHKSLRGLCFWASDPLVVRFY